MGNTTKIDPEASNQIEALLKSAGENARSGNVKVSIDLSLQAWELLPSPKEQWNFYPQIISTGLIDDYVAIKDRSSVEIWITEARRMYGDFDHTNHYILMLEGSSLFKIDLRDKAYYVFERIYQLFGKEGFKGSEQIGYLNFFLIERVKHEK